MYGTEPIAIASQAPCHREVVKHALGAATAMGIVVYLLATAGAQPTTNALYVRGAGTSVLAQAHGVQQVPATRPLEHAPHMSSLKSTHESTAIRSQMQFQAEVEGADHTTARVAPLTQFQAGLRFLMASVALSMVAIVAKFGSPKKSREGPLALAMVTMSGAKTAGKSDTSAQEKTSFAFNADAASFPPITGAGQLRQCIVLLRHGDRAPMTRDMGALVSGEDNEEFWRERLPSPQMLAHMDSRFPIKQHKRQLVAWDEGEQPFCQLTAQGVAEITAIGSALRQRLVKGCAPAQSSILNAVADPKEVHVVSTNTTRTHQTSQVLNSGYPNSALSLRASALSVL